MCGTSTLMSRANMRRGIGGFSALTAAGIGALFVLNLGGPIEDVVADVSGEFFALALLGALADFFIGGLRHHVFLRRLVPGSRLWLPIRADLVGRFTGAVTPSQTGGGPGQIFILHRGGVPLPTILSVLAINLMATMVFFVVFGGAATWVLGNRISAGAIRHLVQWGFLGVAGLIGFLSLSVTRPDVAVRPIEALARRLEDRPGCWSKAIRRVSAVLVDSAGHYRTSCLRCLRESPGLPLVAVGLTVLLYLNKFTLGWCVMRGLGFEGSYAMALAVQAVLHLVLYVAPTPGGAGIAELSTGALMTLLLPNAALVPFTLAYRFFLTYLPAAIGAVLLTLELHPARRTARAAGTVAAALTMIFLFSPAAGPTAVAAQVRPGLDRVVVVPVRSVSALHTPHEQIAERVRLALEEGILATSRADSLTAFDVAVGGAAELARATPDDADAHYLFAVALGQRLELSGTREKIGLGQRCREEAEWALSIDPNHPGAHHVLGRLHAATMRLGRVTRFVARRVLGAEALSGASWDRAESHFISAGEIEPSNPRHWMELGKLYIDTDRPVEAAIALRRAATSTPVSESERLVVERARSALGALECPAC